MKNIKIISAFLMAMLMIFTPYTVCLAETGEDGSYSSFLSPSLISNGFSVDNSSICAGDSFTLKFSVKNTSADVDVRNVNIRLSGAEAFTVSNDSDTLYTDKIGKGASKSFSKAFYCSSLCEGGMYPITVSITYEYFDRGEKQSASTEFSYNIGVEKAAQTAKQSLTPQLLISGFSYGSGEVQGGEIFTLSFKVKNNSSDVKVQNLLIRMSGGEAFIVSDGTDTLAVKEISPNSAQSLSIGFKCLNGAASGIYPISASVSYEYFDGGEKVSASTELTMSIPVVQPDKVQFQGIDLADKAVTVGQETDCAFQVVNSGQTRITNASVKLLDASGSELASAFIGNIEPGTLFASNYTLPVTFSETGSKKLKLVLEYENENTDKKTAEQEFNITVEEYFDPYEELLNEQEETVESTNYVPVIIGCAAGAVVIIIAAIVIAKTVKKRKARKVSENFDEEI